MEGIHFLIGMYGIVYIRTCQAVMTMMWHNKFGARIVKPKEYSYMAGPPPSIKKANKETIWHFTCKECSGYWSIAVMDAWRPYKLYCPHCGDKDDHSTN